IIKERDGIYLRVTTNKFVRHWIYSGGYITADSIVSGLTLPILCSEMDKAISDFLKEKKISFGNWTTNSRSPSEPCLPYSPNILDISSSFLLVLY
ncbi:MAG TPA: hypothetical protein O0X46_07525, partial [Methanocorpusculum sp.]|nr:hypothetical protein [Methanocorpusculum sp.]